MYFDAISFYHPNDLYSLFTSLNPLNSELNPICHLLALLGAHHILHISGLRVNQQSVNISYFYHACYAYHAHNLLPSEVISLRSLKLVHSSS